MLPERYVINHTIQAKKKKKKPTSEPVAKTVSPVIRLSGGVGIAHFNMATGGVAGQKSDC